MGNGNNITQHNNHRRLDHLTADKGLIYFRTLASREKESCHSINSLEK
jgi:hypothetical protein